MTALRGWGALALVATAGFFVACGGETIFGGEGGAGASSQGGNAQGGSAQGGSAQGGSPGTCECDAQYRPVCGDDGMTYDAACGDECVPTAIACEGECPCSDCGQLEQAYATALAEAKVCDPFIDVLQCTERVSDALACPCGTGISPSNTEAVETLSSLQEQWDAMNCGALVDCPAVECPELVGSSCLPTSAGGDQGSCVDSVEGG